MKRRRFLQASTAAGLTMFAPLSVLANPEPYGGRLYAVFNADGGWDTTYLMDPKGGELNRGYGPGEIRMAGNIPYAPTEHMIAPEAMSNRTFFERYSSELLVVNGIDSSVNNHFPCSRYVATGKNNTTRYPIFPALIAATEAPDAPLAFLTFGQYSGTGNLIARTRIPSMGGLVDLAEVDEVGGENYYPAETYDRIQQALGEVAQAPQLPKVQRSREFLFSAQVNSKALENVVPFVPASLPENGLKRQVEVALAAFASGLSASANLQMHSFDSHEANDSTHAEKIPELLAGVDYMMMRAEELGLRDRLVVVMQSEMGRTPWYNGDEGKDHWSVNSWMAMGAGISGNRVVGRTTVDSETGYDQSPAHVNPANLSDDPGGVRLRPEHIQQALREHAGIATHAFSQSFSLGVAPSDQLVGLFG